MSIKNTFFLIKSDLYRYNANTSIKSFLSNIILNRGFKVSLFYRITNYFYKTNSCLLLPAKIIYRYIQRRYALEIPYETEIGSGLYLGHLFGIIISSKAKLGDNVNLSQGVTIGVVNRGPQKGYPTIKNNIYIAPGAKIIGNITIGNNNIIGANCVVITDTPDNAVVVGVPGKVISYDGTDGYVCNTDY